MAIQYKCPSCGAPLVFDAESKMLKCNSCGFTKDVPDFEKKTFDEMSGNHAKTFTCSSCGATLITDENTAATFCKFCGSPTLIEERLTDAVRPSGVIPFSVPRETAIEKFQAWTRRGLFTPSLLRKNTTVEQITGMYVPFWLFDYNARTRMVAKCTRSHSTREGDYQVTYTEHYMVTRDVEANYDMIPADASEKMEDSVMDKLEPFSYNELTPFEMPYLSGYYAEKYNYEGKDLEPRIAERATSYITSSARETIQGYGTVSVIENSPMGHCTDMEYVLMPVWTLTYRWKNENRMFTLNGQTGKIVADRPIDPVRAVLFFLLFFVIAFIILFIGGGFIS